MTELQQVKEQLAELRKKKKELMAKQKELSANEAELRAARYREIRIMGMRERDRLSYDEIAQRLDVDIDIVRDVCSHYVACLEDYDLYGLSIAVRNLIIRNCGGEVRNKQMLIDKLQSPDGLFIHTHGFGKARIQELASYVGFELAIESPVVIITNPENPRIARRLEGFRLKKKEN